MGPTMCLLLRLNKENIVVTHFHFVHLIIQLKKVLPAFSQGFATGKI